MIEPSHISVRSWGQWSLGNDNNNYIDHLRRSQSLVLMVVVEEVVEVTLVTRTKTASGA